MTRIEQDIEFPARAGRVETAHAVDPAGRVRREVVRKLRQQLAEGAYDPPLDELVERLVHLIVTRQALRRDDIGD